MNLFDATEDNEVIPSGHLDGVPSFPKTVDVPLFDKWRIIKEVVVSFYFTWNREASYKIQLEDSSIS